MYVKNKYRFYPSLMKRKLEKVSLNIWLEYRILNVYKKNIVSIPGPSWNFCTGRKKNASNPNKNKNIIESILNIVNGIFLWSSRIKECLQLQGPFRDHFSLDWARLWLKLKLAKLKVGEDQRMNRIFYDIIIIQFKCNIYKYYRFPRIV